LTITPEKGQPHGNKAKQAIADLTFKKQATVVEVPQDLLEANS
jgi:hypothetical protein